MFIKRLVEHSDIAKVNEEFNTILSNIGWGDFNQIGLKHRVNAIDPWFDAAGSLYDRQTMSRLGSESDFTEWTVDTNVYIRQQIEILEKNYDFKCGRVRLMRLLSRRGLSVHRDDEVRYHLVLKTNPKAYIAHSAIQNNTDNSDLPTAAICYHLPMDGSWYEVNTREIHWVYNGGDDERIHLVVCGA